MAEEVVAPAIVQTEGQTEKIVSIQGKSKALDAIIGKDTPTEPVKEPVTTAAEGIKPIPEQTEKDDSIPDPKTEDQSKIKETPKVEESTKVENEEPDDVNLRELYLDVEGQNRSVAELLDERDALKKQLDQISKDPFLKGFIDHYQSTGNASAYIEAKGVDWDKKDSLSVIRAKFEKDNAGLSDKGIEIKWRRKLADTYKIKPDLTQEEMDSEDYILGQEELKRDADLARNEFKEHQSKFQIVDRKQEEKPQQQFNPEVYKKQVLAEKAIADFMKSKLLKLGIKSDTGQSFGFELPNPDQIIEMMVDDRKFLSTFFDFKSKAVDRNRQAKIYAYAMNPDEFEQQLVEFGKNLGLEERLKEVKNTDDRLNRKTTEAQTKESSFTKGFLGAALKQKKYN